MAELHFQQTALGSSVTYVASSNMRHRGWNSCGGVPIAKLNPRNRRGHEKVVSQELPRGKEEAQLDLSSGGDTKEALDELRLPRRVSAIQSFDLPLPCHVYSLDTLKCPVGGVE